MVLCWQDESSVLDALDCQDVSRRFTRGQKVKGSCHLWKALNGFIRSFSQTSLSQSDWASPWE